MINSWVFTKTLVLGDKFLEVTGNNFEYITQRPYHDKKGVLPDGIVLTLRILEDKMDYGTDKTSGKARPTNRGQNFDAVILNEKTELPLEYGEIVALEQFDSENSFAVGYDLVMRFKGIKRLSRAGGGGNNVAQS